MKNLRNYEKYLVRRRNGNRMSSFFTKKQDINMIEENDMHLLNKRAGAEPKTTQHDQRTS
jgi:hypothetical protein